MLSDNIVSQKPPKQCKESAKSECVNCLVMWLSTKLPKDNILSQKPCKESAKTEQLLLRESLCEPLIQYYVKLFVSDAIKKHPSLIYSDKP
jgi:hypothetical protein